MLNLNNKIALILGSISALSISQCFIQQEYRPFHFHSHNLTDNVEKDLEEILKPYFLGQHISLNQHLANYFRFIHIVEERPDLEIPYIEDLILTNLAIEYNSMATLPNCLVKSSLSLEGTNDSRKIFDMVYGRSDLYDFYYETEVFSLLIAQDGCRDIYYLNSKERDNLRQTMFGLIDYVDATSTELAGKYYSLDDSADCIDTSYFSFEEKELLRIKLSFLTNDRNDIDGYLIPSDIDEILKENSCQRSYSEKTQPSKVKFDYKYSSPLSVVPI